MQRYERKFVLEGIPASAIEQLIMLHPAGFRPIYKHRWVNNLYFDDVHRSLFHAHATGQAHRAKYRLRWYGKLKKKKAFKVRAEVKYKAGLQGHKEVEIFKAHDLAELLAFPWPEHPKGPSGTLMPVMYNRYYRRYYQSQDGIFRLTLDQSLMFSAPKRMLQARLDRSPLPFPLVIELKYPAEKDGIAAEISSRFPFPLSKFSKYQTGMKYLYA